MRLVRRQQVVGEIWLTAYDSQVLAHCSLATLETEMSNEHHLMDHFQTCYCYLILKFLVFSSLTVYMHCLHVILIRSVCLYERLGFEIK